MNNQKALLQYALNYARAGFYVFPMSVFLNEETGKKKLSFPFPKAEGWREESTRDEETIRGWFTHPRKGMKGLGLDCGKSGVVVIDLDTDDTKDGLIEWSKLPEQQDTPMKVVTRSGGLHRFYRDPSGLIRNSASEVAPGIDIRGNGGLVIVPPTRVWGSDAQYTLENDEITPVDQLPELTPGMVDIVTTRQGAAKPKFDPAIHGAYRVSRSQGDEIVEERHNRLKSGMGLRAAIFGFAVATAQFEGAKAAQDEAVLDEESLRAFIGERVLDATEWKALDDEDLQWIDDGVTKGLAHPWELVHEDEVSTDIASDVPLHELMQRTAPRMPGHPAHAHALVAPVVVDELVGRYLYVQGLGWHEWVGDRWSSDVRIPVRHAVRQMVTKHNAEANCMIRSLEKNDEFQAIVEERDALKGGRAGSKVEPGTREVELNARIEEVNDWADAWTEYRKWWLALANGRNHDFVMKYVEADPGQIFVRADELDKDPYALNTPSGTVDLRTGSLRRHNPRDLITKTTHVPFDPEATHYLWDEARKAFADGTESWLQLKAGEGAFGFPTQDDTMIFNFGQGSNGKSTLSDAILNSMGDYAVFLHDKALLGSAQDHGTEQMVFRGARWAILEELPEAQVLRPATIKKLIGTSKITARMMRQDNVTFDATHSLMVNSNHRPQVLENDRGTWRRLIAVPWPYTFKFDGEAITEPEDRRADPSVKHALSRDIEVQKAALAWIVAGSVAFYANGMKAGVMPETVARETNDWRTESDTFGAFFDMELVPAKGYAISAREILEKYNEFLEAMGKKPVSDQYIYTRISTLKGCKSVQKVNVRRNAKSYTISTCETLTSLPERFRALVGLRWLTDAERAGIGQE